MNKIFKYELNLGATALYMPAGAKFLSIQLQAGKFMLWALVNSSNEQLHRMVYSFATGEEISEPQGLAYIATVQQGIYVWHFFEKLD